ncbi:hypothetical protein DXG01_012225, partial [Tephrocybe rancida]
IPRLPAYPSTAARKSLCPSQLSTLTNTIASALSTVLALPPAKLCSPSALSVVASYAKHTALVALQSIIWTSTSAPAPSEIQNQIHKRTLRLAIRLAPQLGLPALLDLFRYTPSSQLRAVFSSAYETNPGLVLALNTDVVPALTRLLSPSRALCRTQSHPMRTLRTAERGTSPEAHDPDIDLKLTQILDSLPDTSPSYARALLRHPPFARDKWLERCLKGLHRFLIQPNLHWEAEVVEGKRREVADDSEALALVAERRNVFDDVEMDLGSVWVGKKWEDASTALRDRAAMAALKADILRRAEALSDSSGGEFQTRDVVAYDSDDEVIKVRVKLGGEGEQSDESESESDAEGGGEDQSRGRHKTSRRYLNWRTSRIRRCLRGTRGRDAGRSVKGLGSRRTGIQRTIFGVFKVGLPSVLFGITLQTLSNRGVLESTLPIWLVVSGSALLVPTISVFRTIYKGFDDRRQAAKLGARLARIIRGKSIGNVDILSTMQRFWETGYIADGLIDYVAGSDPVANVRILWSDMIFTAWPKHIKLILATDLNNYEKGSQFRHSMSTVLGFGIFNSDVSANFRSGDMWKFHRSMHRPFYTRDRISDFDLFDRYASTVFTLIKERMRNGHAIGFQDLMSRFTLDSASEFLFGHCVHSFTAGIPYPHNASYVPPEAATPQSNHANKFAAAFLEAQEIISSRERYGWIWPLTEIFEDKTKKPMSISAAPKSDSEEKQTESHVEEGATLIDHLVSLSSALSASDCELTSTDPVVLRDETLNVMIAGRDTMASTLTFVINLMAMYPAVHARLRDEVLAKVGPTRRPDYDDIRDIKYLRAVIKETLRLFPVV